MPKGQKDNNMNKKLSYKTKFVKEELKNLRQELANLCDYIEDGNEFELEESLESVESMTKILLHAIEREKIDY